MPSKTRHLASKPMFHARDRAAWRRWLAANHTRSEGIWLVYDKQPNRLLSAADISEEALCFGWIDGLVRKLSDTQAMIYVSPRKPKSNWSTLNRARTERLISEGLMTENGLARIEEAKRLGTWDAAQPDWPLEAPPDLKRALAKNPEAKKNYAAFPRSSLRLIHAWILSAKREETRAKRVEETVRLAAQNIRVNQYKAV